MWGKDATRRFFGANHWAEPLKWNKKAREGLTPKGQPLREGERLRVFCASMADVGEQRADVVGRELDEARKRLWDLVAETDAIDWLFLTKRPHLYRGMMPREISALSRVWRGVSVESQEYLWRVVQLFESDGAGPTWVSYEPALGWVSFVDHDWTSKDYLRGTESLQGHVRPLPRKLDWIVIGGESKQRPDHQPRPFDLLWPEQLIDAGRASGTAIFVKQFGARPGSWTRRENGLRAGQLEWTGLVLKDRQAGADPSEWPERFRVQEFPR